MKRHACNHSDSESDSEAVLEFDDDTAGRGHSNPEEEGRIVLDAISVIMGAAWEPTGFRINEVDCGTSSGKPLEVHALNSREHDLTAPVEALLRLDETELKQFVRACRAYRLAIVSTGQEPTLGFLLLVTAVECLSTLESFIPNADLDKSKKSTERYVRFIQRYGTPPADDDGSGDAEAFVKNLKTIYYVHRSAYVHGGREVSIAAGIADRFGMTALKHYVDGAEVTTPGLLWFARVVRRALQGYLEATPQSAPSNREGVRQLASARGILTMRVDQKLSPASAQ